MSVIDDIRFALEDLDEKFTHKEIYEIKDIIYKEYDFSEYNEFIVEKALELRENNKSIYYKYMFDRIGDSIDKLINEMLVSKIYVNDDECNEEAERITKTLHEVLLDLKEEY